jgi:hypothetical protein
MDRLTEIKKENGLRDTFYIVYLMTKLEVLTEEYDELLKCKSNKARKIHDHVMTVRKNMIETKKLLKIESV